MPTYAVNKKAKFDYEILEKFEAGIALTGQEVKSVKQGHISLKGSFISATRGELFLTNAHISPYKFAGGVKEYDPTHPRKLLLNKAEISSLLGKIQQKGLTIIPIKVYTKHNRLKVEIGVGRGKRKTEKREIIKKRDIDREIQQKLKSDA